MKKIKILIVDDSALVRKLLSEIFRSDPELQVVGTAGDTATAQKLIRQLRPDVLTLDVELPGTDGLTFLKIMMQVRPMPVIMVSKHTQENSDSALLALQLGAVDCVAKPYLLDSGLAGAGEELISKVKMAAAVNRGALLPHGRPSPLGRAGGAFSSQALVAVGASVGGTEAIRSLLANWPQQGPAMVVVQHIGAQFSESFARSLAKSCNLEVRLARHGDPPLPGLVLLAPGDRHLTVKKSGATYLCALSDGDRVQGHKPSVDVLFHSLARCAGPAVLGVLLTGMGEDGARGLYQLRQAGSHTIAQDEATSVIWGMPGTAVRLQAVDQVLPLHQIAPQVLRRLQR